jgi:hypothetical protein
MLESFGELIRLLLFQLNATNYTDETEILLLNRSSSESSIIIGNSSWNGNPSSFTKWEEAVNYHADRFHFSFTFKVIVFISYNAVLVFALLGNVLVVYVVGFSARMRTVPNFFIGKLNEK